eukprot:13451279-Heterocapsa_arctica.AAC.1
MCIRDRSTIHGNLTQLDLTRKASKRSHLPTNGKSYEAFQRLTNCGNYVKYNIQQIFAGGIADSKRTRFYPATNSRMKKVAGYAPNMDVP